MYQYGFRLRRIGRMNLVIAQFCDVKIVSVAFGKATTERIIMVLISALARTLSIDAFSTFKIFPRMGRMA